MGKRRVGFKKPKKGISDLKNAGSSDDDQIENDLEALLDDEIASYNAHKENSLLSKAKRKKEYHEDSDDEEQEVFGLNVSDVDDEEEGDINLISDEEDNDGNESDEDEDDDDDNDEDILGSKEDGDRVPDSHAWGRKARAYHNTDYVDQDFGGFDGSDAELAEQEEAEAKEIQKRLTAELDEDAFSEFIPQKDTKSKKSKSSGKQEVLKIDFDNMTLTEKRKLIQRECPEVVHMLEEYKEKLKTAKKVKTLIKDEETEIIREFYQTKYHTILNYCINISFYLYLRSSNPSSCKGHPVVKRVVQFRRLLEELEGFDPTKIKSAISAGKKVKMIPADKKSSFKKILSQEQSDEKMEDETTPSNDTEGEKRGITYEMAKNKGLTPVRQKAQRNPRVKHRLKYRKATIRRKGQVRTPRTEVKKYEGEISGIKSHLTKSIKLK